MDPTIQATEAEVPLVSIVIPTFQRFTFLQRAVASVRAQTWSSWEIIVTDDDPSEAAAVWAKELGEERLRYLVPDKSRQAHLWPNEVDLPLFIGNWQAGVSQARGKYLIKLDDDDLFYPLFLEACVNFLEHHPEAASVYTAHEDFVEESRPGEPRVDRSFFAARGYCAAGAEYIQAVLTNRGGYPRNHKTSAFYRREVGHQLEFYRYAPEDFAFSVALALHGRVGYIPQVLYRWRRHSGNAAKSTETVFLGSQAALRVLNTLQFKGNETLSANQWRDCLERCEQKLPLFYLLSLLREGTWEEARCFGRKIRPVLRNNSQLRVIAAILFVMRRVAGKRALALLYHFYTSFWVRW